MSIISYHARLDSIRAEKSARPNLAGAENLKPQFLSGWEETFVQILENLAMAAPVAARKELIPQAMEGLALMAKLEHQREAEECLLVTGPQWVELYLVLEGRQDGKTQKTAATHAQARRNFSTFSDQEAVAQFFRSALGWMPDGCRDRSHIEAFRQAHAHALENELTGTSLNRLFQRALWLFEKVRLETDFFRNPITIDDVLIEVAGKIFGGLKERSALLVGSNEEMPHLADALRQGGIRHLYFTPTARALESSAKTFEWEIWTMSSQEEAPAWPQQMSMLPFIDLLLLLDQSANRQGMRSLLQQLMAMRHNAPLLFADLTTPSSPGDHEKTKPGQSGSTEAGAIAGDTIEKMYNLFFFRRRDLQQMVEQNLRARQQVDGEVSAWISQEVRQFYQWASSEDRFHFGSMVGRSRQMQRVFELIARIAQNDITVLIEGESGTGKELVAQAIHQSSHRARKPFVVVNCGALPESLLESELFGHIRGAFTGAIKNKRGLFEEANDGTIFLDEIGEMSPALQMKLLRFLQDGEIKRVGSNTVLKLEVRVLTATNRNLQQMVNEGKFRSDLYYRLNVIQITLPPLRERMEDLPILASHFLRKYAGRLRKPLAGISPEAMQKLSEYNWPGNVRELENVMERAVALASDIKLGIADFPDVIRKASGAALQHSPSEVIAGSTIGANRALRPTLEEVERQYILETVTACEGNYDEAAKQLGIGRTTLWRKLKMYQNENGKPPL